MAKKTKATDSCAEHKPELMQILIGIKPPFHIHDGLARIVTFETEEDKDDEPYFCTSCM